MPNVLERWEEVSDQYAAIEEFLAWCSQMYGLQFDYQRALLGTPLELKRLLNEFFQIDPNQLELERRRLLEAAGKPRA